MCSTAGTGHFANFVQRATGSCSRPAPGGTTVEPIRVSRRAEGNLRDQDAIALKMLSVDDPPDRESLLQRIRAMEGLLNETFCTISTLKTAYIQLQAAHVPYDAEKLQTADEAVIKEMKRLSELKQFYKENCIARRADHPHHQSQSAALGNSCVEDLALKPSALSRSEDVSSKAGDLPKGGSEIETLKDVLENVKKGSEFGALKDIVENASIKRGKARRHNHITDNYNNNTISVRDNVIYSRRPNSGLIAGHPYSAPTIKLFEATVQKMKESARAFTKCLICLMKSAGWDLDAAVRSIEPGIEYARHCHKKLAFRSYACLRMLEGFENEDFSSTGSLMSSVLDAEKRRNECFCQFQAMQQMEPMQLLSITPDCPFGKFCLKKFLHIVHPKMEESFFGGFEHRNLIVNGGHPRSQFYGVFLQFAKCAWLVHRLAFSFDPAISVFHVKRGAAFRDSYMENLNTAVAGTGDIAVADGGKKETAPNPVRFVGFTVIPGFRFGNRALVRCQVYLADAICS